MREVVGGEQKNAPALAVVLSPPSQGLCAESHTHRLSMHFSKQEETILESVRVMREGERL